MSQIKGDMLYEGKAKRIFSIIDHPEHVLLEFKNSLTAFNALKKDEMSGKGRLNCLITTHIFNYLQANQIKTHWIKTVSETEMVCEKANIIPLEVVVRNTLAGSTAKKFAIDEGTELEKPLVEFFYKNDDLEDPFVSDDQALMIKAVEKQSQLDQLKQEALKINQLLLVFFKEIGIKLVDFKVEFGVNLAGEVLLVDEITPDSCRLWDDKTHEKLDKDRFRRDLGKVTESYELVLNKIEKVWGQK